MPPAAPTESPDGGEQVERERRVDCRASYKPQRKTPPTTGSRVVSEILIQASALIGALLIVGAFAALQRGLTTSTSPAYLWANLVGSSLLAVVAIIDRRMGFILLETVWAGVSLWSIVRPARRATPA